jgi:hypothetical protein
LNLRIQAVGIARHSAEVAEWEPPNISSRFGVAQPVVFSIQFNYRFM